MAKKKMPVRVEKCECSGCGQEAHVVPNKSHEVCRGFRLVKPLPVLFHDLKNPKRVGQWIPITSSEPTTVA